MTRVVEVVRLAGTVESNATSVYAGEHQGFDARRAAVA